jgi:hypothetical protein
MQSYYDMTEQEKTIKALGEAMMDLAIYEKDHEKSNKMAYIGRELSLAGTPFAKRYEDFDAGEQSIVIEVFERLKLGKKG